MEQNNNKNKFKYVRNILTDKLILEENDLKFWQNVKPNSETLTPSGLKMVETNLKTTEHRINELKEFITNYL